MSESGEISKQVATKNIWLTGADGERQAVRVDSSVTRGAYSVIESQAEPGCAVPTHLHRNEDEHFLVISGRYRIAIGVRILDAMPGTRATVPRNTPNSWRNIAPQESRLLAILTPGGFEQIVYAVKDTSPEQIKDLAARFGCDILGPPVAESARPLHGSHAACGASSLIEHDVGDNQVERLLGPLLDQGPFGLELIASLDAFLTAGMNTAAAAKLLVVPPNTLRYRINQVTKLTGINLRSARKISEVVVDATTLRR